MAKSNGSAEVKESPAEKKKARKAALLSLIPGGGQFYNGQLVKGFLFLVIFLLFCVELIVFGGEALGNFVTLGTVPREDHSLFLLIEGVLQIIITGFFLVFYVINLYDAHRVGVLSVRTPEKVNRSSKQILHDAFEKGFPYLLTVPALVVMVIAILFPVLVTLFLAFTNYDFHHIPPAKLIDWVGVKTFLSIFTLSSYRNTFVSVFSWTIIWTVLATTLQLVIGIFTAVVLNQPFVKLKRLFGVILLLPWAVPAFITILTFSNMFNPSAGAINTQVIPFLNKIIPFISIPAVSWKTNPFWTKVAIILIQGWLGYPYIYVLASGILQSIPKDWYEAAVIDGASTIQKFRYITFPQMLAVAGPIFVTQYTGNFNNFNVIYLFNEGGPGSVGNGAGSTDILISWIYKLTTGQSPQYNIASAVTLIISAVTIFVSLLVFKRSAVFNMED